MSPTIFGQLQVWGKGTTGSRAGDSVSRLASLQLERKTAPANVSFSVAGISESPLWNQRED